MKEKIKQGMEKSSTLYIVATPIGNLEDISYRAIRILASTEAIACEDTRRTRLIFQRYSLPSPRLVISYHEHNEKNAGEKIIKLLSEGTDVVLCSNAGYPGISDPGYRIIKSAIDEGYRVEIIPGASAVSLSLLYSGLPTSSYTFKGFPPRKPGPMRRWLEMEKDAPHTLIFFESPRRLAKFLSVALEVFGNRQAAVCIELTKLFERVHRNYLEVLCQEFKDKKIKGEVTVVIAGNNPKLTKEN